MASVSAGTSEQKTAVEMFHHLKTFLRSGNSLGILVSGKTGVGKSSLVNSIYLGAEVAPEGDSVTPVTEFIISYSKSFDTPCIDGESGTITTLTAWDTPGFGDIFADEESEKKRIEELKFVVDKADILLYCFDIRTRITRDDVDGIVKITKAGHSDVWRKSVFVLTFANKMEIPPSSSDTSLVSHFKYKLQEWDKQIRSVLRQHAKVPEDIVQDISVVPVGYGNCSLPDRDDWYTVFWTEVFKKTRESGKPGLLRLTWSKLSCDSDKTLKDSFNQQSMSNDTLSVKLFSNVTDHLGNTLGSHQPAELRSDSSNQESQEPVYDGQEHSLPSICLRDSVQPCPNPVRNEPRLNVGRGNNIAQESKTSKKIVQAGGSIGTIAVSGAIVGLLVGIAGGPIGMGIGAATGFVAGAGTGAASVIAHTIKEHMERTRQRTV